MTDDDTISETVDIRAAAVEAVAIALCKHDNIANNRPFDEAVAPGRKLWQRYIGEAEVAVDAAFPEFDALRSPPADVGEAAKVLLAADDWMPVQAKIAAVKAHTLREGKTRPVTIVEGWRAALRALAETTKGDE